ncbi:MAG: FHA domain-containing protein [Leptolyngbyaceae cyanobacterium bins.59]|nr:FHA domain-containing protein [Leptolyngbyaceae cyanobacterium bins.59]
MITLTLLHANKDLPAQSWTFQEQPVIRIGRAPDNHVVLYSAVVSRHHVELHHNGSAWEVINLGANGTYWDGKRIDRVGVIDGMTIRLARSGPNVQIHLEASAAKPGVMTPGSQALNQLTNTGHNAAADTVVTRQNTSEPDE